ncbi:MAG: lipoprotein [Anaeroplasma sp.]
MKKIFFTFILILLLSSCNSIDYTNEINQILDINIDNYQNELSIDNENRAVYMSNESSRVYYFVENNEEYKMIVEDSFYNKKLTYERPKKDESTTTDLSSTTTEDFVEVEDVIIKYTLNSDIINVSGENNFLNNILDKESFIDYCFNFFNDTRLDIQPTINSLINETLLSGKVEGIIKTNTKYFGICNLVHAKIQLSKMKSNYESENKNSNYFNLIMKYIGDDKYNVFISNILSLTMNVLGGAGSLEVMFYVSNDYKTVYPNLIMKNGDISFFNIDLTKPL